MEEYDFVIVGAGSAGCALASRLTEREGLSVLLLEAGGVDSNFWIHVPLGVGKLLQDTRYVWPFATAPEPTLNSKPIYWPRGKVLGGSSSINGMVYVRGDPAEFDYWENQGNSGWSYSDIARYYKRLECYPEGNPEHRGHHGPMHIVNRGSWNPDPISDSFIEACMEAGIQSTTDYNAGSYEGVSYLQKTGYRGRRWSSADAYITKSSGRRNLTLKTHSVASRVLFKGNRARGIEYRKDGKTYKAYAQHEVLLCAGSIQSPQLLELSGIGKASILGRYNIPIVQELPGVGENLQDHLQVRLTYRCTRPLTINDIMRSPIRRWGAGLQYICTHRGLLSTTSSTVHALTRSDATEKRVDIKVQLALISGENRYSRSAKMGIDKWPGVSIGLFMLRPISRGSIHVSSNEISDQPVIRANYLRDEREKVTYLKGLRRIREIASQPAFRRLISNETRPGLNTRTDSDLLSYMARTGQTSWHPISSCRMGCDGMAVVDSRLRVHGVEGLRVIDASVMPTMASSNTNGPALMIGEKGADLVLRDLDGADA